MLEGDKLSWFFPHGEAQVVCYMFCGIEFLHLFNFMLLNFVHEEFSFMKAVRSFELHSLILEHHLHDGQACICVDWAGWRYSMNVRLKSEVLNSSNYEDSAFWDAALCILMDSYQCFAMLLFWRERKRIVLKHWWLHDVIFFPSVPGKFWNSAFIRPQLLLSKFVEIILPSDASRSWYGHCSQITDC
jgi:hypothetical protein